jgi:hypothetical protein
LGSKIRRAYNDNYILFSTTQLFILKMFYADIC